MREAPGFSALDRQKFGRFHVKTILVSGIGFFTDAMDVFVINLAIPMIGFVWFYNPDNGGDPARTDGTPPLVKGLLKASTQVGTLIGQLLFGYLSDRLGRKAMYGLVLALMIGATINTALAADTRGAIGVAGMLVFWRLVLGIGIGGDYPISAVIASEFAAVRTRGLMVAAVFAMQGMGILFGCVCAVAVLAALRPTLVPAEPGASLYAPAFDNVWRLLLLLGVVPALAAVYWRMKLPESPRFSAQRGDVEMAMVDMDRCVEESSARRSAAADDAGSETACNSEEEASISRRGRKGSSRSSSGSSDSGRRYYTARPPGRCTPAAASHLPSNQPASSDDDVADVHGARQERYAHLSFGQLFGNWANGKVLFGTTAAWFLLDVGFYGVQLNQSELIKYMGYGGGADAYEFFFNQALGNLLLSLCGTVPGYIVTIFTIEKLGRVAIQALGFTALALIFAVLAVFFDALKGSPAFFALFVFANFFFNFGPNATTFIVPAELFPTKFRSTCHGLSAAAGKLGAIVAAFGFDQLVGADGKHMSLVLGVFAGCMGGGLLCTALIPETRGRSLEELGDAFYRREIVSGAAAAPIKTTRKKGKAAASTDRRGSAHRAQAS